MSQIIKDEEELNNATDPDLRTEYFDLELLGLKSIVDLRKFSRSFMKIAKILFGIENNKLDKGDYTGNAKNLNDEISKKASSTQLGRMIVGTGLTDDGNGRVSHSTGAGNNHIPANGATGNFLKWLSNGVAQWANITWSDITGKPSTYTPDTHTHDDRYYTENEINTKLDGKANTNHTHDYASSSHTHTPSSIGAVNKTGDTLTGAINFANNTWNKFGDDVSIGDCNQSGKIGIKGLNGATGIYFYPYSGSTVNTISIDGAGNLTISGTTIGTFKGNISGNSTTATTLQTARTLTIGSTGKNFNGGANLAWSLAEIGVYSKAETDEKFKNFCPFPINSLYLSLGSENPSTLWLGTTWQKQEGRFLLGSSSSYSLGATGGASSIALSVANMPSHTHSASQSAHTHSQPAHTHVDSTGITPTSGSGWSRDSNYNTGGAKTATSSSGGDTTGSATPSISIGATGSGTAFSILPPYLVVNIWKRLS